MAISPDASRLYLSDFWGGFHIWDLQGESAVAVRWPRPPRDIASLALSPDGATLAVGGRSGIVTLYDTATGTLRERLDADPETEQGTAEGFVSALAFSPDGAMLAVGTQQGPVVLWSVDDPTVPRLRLPGHRGMVTSLAFDHSGDRLATAGSDRVIDVWDFAMLREEFARLGLGW